MTDPQAYEAFADSFLGSGWTVGLAHEAPRPDRDRGAQPGHLGVRRGALGLAAEIAAPSAHYENRPVDAMADQPRDLTRSVILDLVLDAGPLRVSEHW